MIHRLMQKCLPFFLLLTSLLPLQKKKVRDYTFLEHLDTDESIKNYDYILLVFEQHLGFVAA